MCYTDEKGGFLWLKKFINQADGVVRQYLATSKTLAVVGLSDREETTSNRVTKEMQARGYKNYSS